MVTASNPVHSLWIKRALASPVLAYWTTVRRLDDPAGRHRRSDRLSAGLGMPAQRVFWKSGLPAGTSLWSASPIAFVPFAPLDSTCSASANRPPGLRRGTSQLRLDRFVVRRQSAGVSRTVALPRTAVSLSSGTATRGATAARHRFLPRPGAGELCDPARRSDPTHPLQCRRASDFAVIHPFSGSARKNWPLEKFHRARRGIDAHPAGSLVRRARRSAARRRGPHRRSLRIGLLAGERAPLHRQRFRHHPPGGGGGHSGAGALRPHRPRGVGAARAKCAGGLLEALIHPAGALQYKHLDGSQA